MLAFLRIDMDLVWVELVVAVEVYPTTCEAEAETVGLLRTVVWRSR